MLACGIGVDENQPVAASNHDAADAANTDHTAFERNLFLTVQGNILSGYPHASENQF